MDYALHMMKSAFTLLFVSALALVFAGCEKSAPVPDSAVLFQVVQDNVHSMEKKDLDAVMATIHPQSPSYASMREVLGEMFKVLDLKFTLSDMKVVNASPDEAQVSFVQKTEKAGGTGDFRGNIVEGIHTLRPSNGKWKIYWTLQSKVTDLQGKPLNAAEPSAAPATPPDPAASPAPVPAAEPAPAPAVPPAPAPPAEKPAQ